MQIDSLHLMLKLEMFHLHTLISEQHYLYFFQEQTGFNPWALEFSAHFCVRVGIQMAIHYDGVLISP